jgi:hypothetical protein
VIYINRPQHFEVRESNPSNVVKFSVIRKFTKINHAMQHLKSLEYGGVITHIESGLLIVNRAVYQKVSSIQILEWAMKTTNAYKSSINPWVTIGNYINGKNINSGS